MEKTLWTVFRVLVISVFMIPVVSCESEIEPEPDPSLNTTDVVVTGMVEVFDTTYVIIDGYVNLHLLPQESDSILFGLELSENGKASVQKVIADSLMGNKFQVEFFPKFCAVEYKYRAFVVYVDTLACVDTVYYGDYKTFFFENHVHAIDLGLSVKWACCNVKSNSPLEQGSYYAWGETKAKSEYTVDTYLYYDDEEYQNIGWDISETNYDAAFVEDSVWRMPTETEIEELCDKCVWQWTEIDGISGYKVTGPTGNSIFLSAAGSYYGANLMNNGEWGFYWSSALDRDDEEAACVLAFRDGLQIFYGSSRTRSYGHTIRPVRR